MEKHCQVCKCVEKKDLQICTGCKKLSCRFCLPIESALKLCIKCMKNLIREEIMNENKEKLKKLECELVSLQDSAQKYQVEIESLTDKCVEIENHAKALEISHIEKIDNIEKSLEKVKENQISYTVVDNLELALENCKKSERNNRKKFEEVKELVNCELCLINSIKEQIELSQSRVYELKSQDSCNVNYEFLRSMSCHKCLVHIKIRFKEKLANAFNANESVMKSLLNHNYVSTNNDTSVLNTGNSVYSRGLVNPSYRAQGNEKCVCCIY